jgi:hypothetical protein
MLIQFKEYADNTFMATNASVEIDIVAVLDGFGMGYELSTSTESRMFNTFKDAAKYADAKYGISEEAMYEEMFLRDSDGYACLGGQI